jgi:hypothetical protein
MDDIGTKDGAVMCHICFPLIVAFLNELATVPSSCMVVDSKPVGGIYRAGAAEVVETPLRTS